MQAHQVLESFIYTKCMYITCTCTYMYSSALPSILRDIGPSYSFSTFFLLWCGIGVEPMALMWTPAPPTTCFPNMPLLQIGDNTVPYTCTSYYMYMRFTFIPFCTCTRPVRQLQDDVAAAPWQLLAFEGEGLDWGQSAPGNKSACRSSIIYLIIGRIMH